LRWSLSKLRSLVNDPDQVRILATRELVSFDPDGAHIDLPAAKALLDGGIGSVETSALKDVEAEFRGDFLEGLELSNCPDFEVWRIAVREEARTLHRRLLSALIGRHAGDAGAALSYARSAVGLDPDDAGAHALLLRLLTESGGKDAVEEQYGVSLRQLRDHDVPVGPLVAAWREMRRKAPSAPSPPMPAVSAEAPASAPVWSGVERKFATVLVACVHRAATGPSASDPEELSRQSDALAALRPLIEGFGGMMGVTLGNSAIVVFGAPRTLEDHAVQACRAALAMRSAILANSMGELGLSACLDSGEVLVRVGAAGIETIGPAIQTAAQLVHPLPAGMLAVTPDVFQRTKGYFRYGEPETYDLKNAGGPVALRELQGATPARTRWDLSEARGFDALVGRSAELATLDEARRKASGSRGRIVAVVGDAGIGKSRLTHHFAGTLSDAGWMVLCADSAPHETGAFLPIRRLLRNWLGIPETDDPAEVARRLWAMVEPLDPGLMPAIPALSWLLDLSVEDVGWMRMGASQRQRSIIASFLALLTAQARRGPVVIVVDDLHWGDEESIAVIDGLVRILPSTAILLLVTYRPGFRDGWTGHSCYTLCHLDPLADEHADALLSRLLGSGEDLDPVKQGMIRQAEGNPLFLEEMARALVEAGRLAGRPGAYRAVGELNDLGLPATVQDVIAARIDLLGLREKQVLQTAAVLGRTVPADLLMAVCPLEEEPVRDALASLNSAEFLHQTRFLPSAEYRFKHVLTRQVAYGSLPRPRRTALHAAAAAAMEALWADSLGGVIDSLADHCEAGERWDKAARYLIQAAAKAKSRYGLAQAITLAERALAAADRAYVEALTLLGDLLSLRGDLAGANGCYGRALALEKDERARPMIANRLHRPLAVTRAGGRIAYYEHGAGSTTLVFIHPFVYGLPVFQPLIEELCQEFRIITIDPRGTGASDPLTSGYDMHDHTEDVRAVLAEAGGGRPVVAVGISRGVLLLLRLAVLYPELLSRIVLVGGYWRQTVGLGAEVPAGGQGAAGDLMAALKAGYLRRAVEIFAPTIFSEPGTEELRKQFIDQCLNLPEATIRRFFTFDPKNDVSDLLGRVALPTLLAHGGETIRTYRSPPRARWQTGCQDRRSTASKERATCRLSPPQPSSATCCAGSCGGRGRSLREAPLITAVEDDLVQIGTRQILDGHLVITAAAIDQQLLDILVVKGEWPEIDAIEQKVVAALLNNEFITRRIGAVHHLGIGSGAAIVGVGPVAVVPHDGIMAGTAVVLVVALVADQQVVPAVAIQFVGRGAAEQFVVAVATPGLDLDFRGAGVEFIMPLAAVEPDLLQVGPGKAIHLEAVVTAVAVQFQLLDVLVIQGEGEGADAVEQEVLTAGLQRELLVTIAAVYFLNVIAIAAVVEIGAVTVIPDDTVMTIAAVALIAAFVTDQDIVAVLTIQNVVAVKTLDQVVAVGTVENVVAVVTDDGHDHFSS
jgi:pimeloyl-ACP methyl ester carboxylesterase/DNA-binding SARP family transcriptional activator